MSFGFPVFLQPRTGQTGQGSTDPGTTGTGTTGTAETTGTDTPGTAGTTDPGAPGTDTTGTAGTTGTDTTTPDATTTIELTQEQCQAANKHLFLVAAGYDAGGIIAGLLMFFVLRRKLIGTFTTRVLAGIFTAMIVVIALGHVREHPEDFTRCLNSEFRRYLFLQSAEVARTIVLLVLPTSLLTALGCWGINKT
jgi:hypothetical protein